MLNYLAGAAVVGAVVVVTAAAVVVAVVDAVVDAVVAGAEVVAGASPTQQCPGEVQPVG